MDVSIVIPTKNGGEKFKEVLKMIFSQKTELEYEVICVDSGSKDNTLEIIKSYPCKLYEISPDDFGHGKTRNFGASKGTGEFIVFITQDAIPASDKWLDNFVKGMRLDDSIAGGFGIHYVYPDCNEIDKRDIKQHFLNFGTDNTIYYIDDLNRYTRDQAYRQFLSFFSDNNSCLRRSIWEKYPYKDVNFAEDQIWAREVLEAGYKKLYCPFAPVYHSHNFPLKTYYKRYYDEFKGLYTVFGNVPFESKKQANQFKKMLDKQDIMYILKNKEISNKLYWIYYAMVRNKYKCKGAYLAGKYFTEYPKLIRDYLDTHISQQYDQIHSGRDIDKQTVRPEEKKELLKWLFLNPNYLKDKAELEKKKKAKNNKLVLANSIKDANNVISNLQFVIDRYNPSFPFVMEDYMNHQNDECKLLNWVIPTPGAGGGGMQTIMRFISKLEKRNYHSRIYLLNPGTFKSDAECKKFIIENYYVDSKDFEVFINIKNMEYAHAAVATSWETAYAIRRFNNCITKYYFVQDYEPEFHPVGAEYSFAENTYKWGFRGITAGDWLKDKLSDEFGMKTDSFLFSYDKELYYPKARKDDKTRVTFYARPFTARRAFEFGVIVLSELVKRIPDLEIIMVGADLTTYNLDFNYINSGVVPVSGLSEIYSNSDLCLVLSSTNLSLLPLEIMASNSVAVCTKGANSEWLVNDGNSILVDFNVEDVVNKMEYYLTHKELLEDKRKAGLDYAKSTSWDSEVDKIAVVIRQGINEDETNLINKLHAGGIE